MRAFEWLERQVDLHGIRIWVPRKPSLKPEPARLQARYERSWIARRGRGGWSLRVQTHHLSNRSVSAASD